MPNEPTDKKPDEKPARPWPEIAVELSKTKDSDKAQELVQELIRALEREKGPRH